MDGQSSDPRPPAAEAAPTRRGLTLAKPPSAEPLADAAGHGRRLSVDKDHFGASEGELTLLARPGVGDGWRTGGDDASVAAALRFLAGEDD